MVMLSHLTQKYTNYVAWDTLDMTSFQE